MRVRSDKMINFFQRLGKAIMLPISALPVAALMLRLGQPDIWGPNLFSGNGIPWMVAAGEAIMNQVNLLFAIGIAIGLADDNNGAAGLSGAIGYFVLANVSNTIINQNYEYLVEGYNFDVGFLGGAVSGIVAGVLYNKYKEIKLPEILGFFGGKRFIPIITSFVMIVLGFGLGHIWIRLEGGIKLIGSIIATSGVLGPFIFGFLNRLLIPFGVHHIINSIAWFQIGEFINSKGEIITGDVLRFLNGDVTAGAFQTGFFPIMMFGLPAVCLAMLLAAKKENRKSVMGMLLGMAATSFLTGVTEPIEFMFLFLSPALFVIHAVLTGVSLALTSILGMRNGYSFSASFIDYILNFKLAEKPIGLLSFGLFVGIIYFIIFYLFIIKFDLQTPGRDRNDNRNKNNNDKINKYIIEDNKLEEEAIKIKPIKSKVTKTAEDIVDAVGGIENIIYVDSCVTRVRLSLKDTNKIDRPKLKKVGSIEVIGLGKNDIQIIIGTMADPIVTKIRRLI